MGSGLELHAVSKRYSWRGSWVLQGVSIDAHPGTLQCIVGANGSGKSTLMRIAAGVSSPSKGVADVPARVGYLPERQPAGLKFTTADYLNCLGRIRGLPAPAIAKRGTQLLERLGLQPDADVPWENLSKGNRQKVLIAQAFLAPTDLMVLDEPYSGLDGLARAAVDELIAEARAQESAVLVSAHQVQVGYGTDHVWQLTAAGLDPFAPATPAWDSRVRAKRLVVTTTHALPLDPLRSRSGVQSLQTDGSPHRLALIVTEARSDDILRSALEQGWSVESVNPILGEPS